MPDLVPYQPVLPQLDLSEIIETLENGCLDQPRWPSLTQDPEPVAQRPVETHDHETALPGVTLEGDQRSLVSWPIQLALVSAKSSFLNVEKLILVADCVAFTGTEFHRLFSGQGYPLVIGCPKLDDGELYVAKLSVIMRDNPELTEILIPIMEVPCCRGMWRLAKKALVRSKRHDIKLTGWIFAPTGRPLERSVNVMVEVA
jgi:hypothetical protein